MPATPPVVYQLKVTLRGSRPLIWRRILVAAGTSLGELHPILQVAMGWQGAHLHLFQSVDGVVYGDPEEDSDDMMGYVDEFSVPLEAVLVREKQRLRYEYDFGDSWEHEIVLEKVLPASSEEGLPRCIKAVGQCPPEDVGGMFGFYQFVEAMADPAHPDPRQEGTDLGSVPATSTHSQGTDLGSAPDHDDPHIKRTRLFEHLFRPAGPLRGLS